MFNLNELNFGAHDFTWLIAGPVAIVLLAIYSINRLRIERRLVISPANEAELLPQLKRLGRTGQIALLTIAVLLIGSASLRPQYGFEWMEGAVAGSDIVVALDVSRSMLANDIAPSRLARAKREIATAVDRLQGSRIALLSFAGVSFTESPLTRDYSAFKQLLSTTDEASVPIPGSNIELAIERAVKLLDGTQPAETSNLRRRTVLIVTDGEELQGSVQEGAELLRKRGIELLLLGVGTDAGAPVPFPTDDDGAFQPSREKVITQLNRANLQAVAKEANGEVLFLDQNLVSGTADSLTKLLLGQNSANVGTNRARVYTEYFQIPLLIGILLLAFAWRPALLVLLITLGAVQSANAADSESLGAKAQQLLEQGKLEEAHAAFEAAAQSAPPNDPRPLLGLGSTLYREGKFDEAAKAFADAESRAPDGAIKAATLFNKGNALLQADKTEEAVAAYEQGLKITPNDREMKQNLAVAKKIQKQKSPEQQQKQDQKKEQSDDQQSKDSDQQKNDSGDPKDNQEKDDSGSKDQSESKEKGSQDQDQQQQKEQQEQQEKDKQQDQNKQEKQDQQSGGKPKDDEKKKEEVTPENQQAAGTPNDNNEEKKDSGEEQQLSNASEATDQQSEKNSQLIKSVTESRKALAEFREHEGEQILKEKGLPFPHKDW